MAKVEFNKEQLNYIKHSGPESSILSATAGSGKTTCATGRLIWLLNKGVNPKKIIYFSFTNDAVNELRSRINNDDIEITTIHSFCARVLGKCKKFKPLVDTSMFPNWFKKKYKPKKRATIEEKIFYNRACRKLDEDTSKIFSDIGKFKIKSAEGIKDRIPPFLKHYQRFLIETRTRDFADMLTDTLHLTSCRSWENNWEYMYDYVFVDEYQDTSALQMKILLALRAKKYDLIGDRNQEIYGFQGSDCEKIENLLKEKKVVKEYSLTVNYRSYKNIIDYSNMYSDLEAQVYHKGKGYTNMELLSEQKLLKLLREDDITILARTNRTIKDLELMFLSKKIPMSYRNILSEEDLELIDNGTELNKKQIRKFKKILPYFPGTAYELADFIRENIESNTFITSIHKSKGHEYNTCIIVNSVSPEILEKNDIQLEDNEFKRMSFDPNNIEDNESKNIHYVAVTRAKYNLNFMLVDEDSGSIIF